MKRIIGVLGLLSLLAAFGSAQNPAPLNNKDNEQQQLLALVKEVQAQQGQITANQGRIDSKLEEVAEAVRVARIFAGRGGH